MTAGAAPSGFPIPIPNRFTISVWESSAVGRSVGRRRRVSWSRHWSAVLQFVAAAVRNYECSVSVRLKASDGFVGFGSRMDFKR